jgi:hypothetical protein
MARVDTAYPALRRRRERDADAALGPVLDAIAEDLAARFAARAPRTLPPARRRARRDVLHSALPSTAGGPGRGVARALGDEVRARKWDPEVMQPWLRTVAANIAEGETEYWQELVRHLAENPDQATDAAMDALAVRIRDASPALASDMATTAMNFAAQDAAEANDADLKIWRTNSTNPRESHAAMSGESQPISGQFSNGLRQPGGRGPAAETANCRCSLLIVKG